MTTTSPNASVLILGASRGLGHAIAAEYLRRGSRVVGTVRGAGTPLHELRATAGDRLEIERLDITEAEQLAALRTRLEGRRFDFLLVNAGVANGMAEDRVAEVTTGEFNRLMVTNALSPMRAVEALGDLVDPAGTIAVMSSGMGSLTNNIFGTAEVYRATKSAVNQLMRSYDARHRDERRTLLLLAPGWVKTDLGGPDAHLTIEQSIPNLVTTIDAQRGTPGLQYLDPGSRRLALHTARLPGNPLAAGGRTRG